jgi:hypothetical protein
MPEGRANTAAQTRMIIYIQSLRPFIALQQLGHASHVSTQNTLGWTQLIASKQRLSSSQKKARRTNPTRPEGC